LNDGRIQNPSNPFGIVPLSNFVPRGFGFVHHSIAIIYHDAKPLSHDSQLFDRCKVWLARATRLPSAPADVEIGGAVGRTTHAAVPNPLKDSANSNGNGNGNDDGRDANGLGLY
jgi:hypothetical protein